MEFITKNAAETKELGKKIGTSLKGGAVLALSGELGAGKTTFVQGLAEGLGIKAKIISPTFILMRHYDNLYHLDLYRLEGDVWNEVKNLGVNDFWGRDNNVFVIEWAEKIKDHLPKETKLISFEQIDENQRRIVIK